MLRSRNASPDTTYLLFGGAVSDIATLKHERTILNNCSVKKQNPSAIERKHFAGSGAR
jgi:hypothetical protein